MLRGSSEGEKAGKMGQKRKEKSCFYRNPISPLSSNVMSSNLSTMLEIQWDWGRGLIYIPHIFIHHPFGWDLSEESEEEGGSHEVKFSIKNGFHSDLSLAIRQVRTELIAYLGR